MRGADTAPAVAGPVAGTWPLVRLLLRRDRIRLPVWLLGITAVTGASANAVVGFYDTPAKRAGYAATVQDSAVSRLFGGIPRDADTMGGIISIEVTAVAAVAAAFMVIFLVVRHTRGEEESGRAELLRATVVGRHAALTATLLVAVGASAVLGALLAAILLTAGVSVDAAVLFGAGMVGTGLVFTAVAAVVAQLAGRARRALGLASGVVLVAFLVRGYGAIDETWWTWASPFGWQDELRPFGDEARWWPLGVSLLTAAVVGALAAWLAAHRDFGAGLLAERPGSARGSASLGTSVGLAWRQQRGLWLSWVVGLVVLGATFGGMSREVRTMIASNPEIAEVVLGAIDDVVLGYLAYVVNFTGVVVGAYAVVSALRMRHEEAGGQTELVLATGVSRLRWMLGWVVVTWGATVSVLALAGLATGLTYGLVDDDLGQVDDLFRATLATAPAALLLASVVALLHGWLPRWAAWAWLPVVWAGIQAYLGDLLDFPEWVRGLSPYHHLALLPAEELALTPALVQLGIAVVLTAVGVVGLLRRDLG
ncbi:ABC transporter permease [Nocardioides daphniae]|uniref:Anibiotic ABC transporter n=1 Tax=Nocardioides daphniae TaxID=402297 RepID=A0A4P7U9S6_9ACTN|nr:anibiotic ABC transporter [Nocardioides daphniae]QCC76364.1 anibiotic ABC transporter [Nocardioides daphniae]GGD07522.1 exporter of polyketide antibiotics [Nocardioides daphniae]